MERDERLMRLAIHEAGIARDAGEAPVGAVLVKGGEVICSSGNVRERARDPVGHAEIACLRKAATLLDDWRLDGCELFVTLEPCAMCAGAIAQARLSRVVFGAYDARAGCCGSVYRITEDPELGFFVKAEGGVLREECEALLKGAAWKGRATP